MTRFSTIDVRQPRAFDLVPDEFIVAGVGVGFEANIGRADLLDSAGAVVATSDLHPDAGGMTHSTFTAVLQLAKTPASAQGMLHVVSDPMIDPACQVYLPVVIGSALISPYGGFSVHTVQPGDTLWAIASAEYGDGALWPRIFEANRDLLTDPDLIFAGQELRVPQPL